MGGMSIEAFYLFLNQCSIDKLASMIHLVMSSLFCTQPLIVSNYGRMKVLHFTVDNVEGTICTFGWVFPPEDLQL